MRVPAFGLTRWTRPQSAAGLAGFRAVFVARRGCSLRRNGHYNIGRQQYQAGKRAFMQQQPPEAEFGIVEARRVLGEVFSPWGVELNIAIGRFDFGPPAAA